KNSTHAEGKKKKNDRDDEIDLRVLELRPPARAFPGGYGETAKNQKRKQHAECENQPMGGNFAPVVSRLPHKAQNLDAEHGKNAGHEIENEAAEECQNQGAGERGGGAPR